MKKQKSSIGRGVAALILLTAIFASLSILARYLATGFTILQQVYLRVFVALLLALVVFRGHLRWNKVTQLPAKEWSLIAFRGFVLYTVGVALISKAATMTLIGNIAFISALPFVSLLGFVFLKEKLAWWKLAFIAGSLLGVSLLAIKDSHNILSWGAGDVVAIIATLGFAVAYVTRKWHSDTLNNQEITTLTFVFGSTAVLLISLLLGEGTPSFRSTWTLWLAILLGGILNVANIFLVNYGFQYVDAVRAGNLLTLESAWGLLFGLLFYGEWPNLRGLLGGVVIIMCVIGMNIYSKRAEAKLAPIQEELEE